MASSVVEQSSLSNPFCARVRHMQIEFIVDFSSKRINGTVHYSVDVLDGTELRLDTNHLDVHSTSVAGLPVDVTFGPEVEPFGRPLIVPLADTPAGSSIIVSVTFSTTPESAAVQWLSPEQTAGKVQPYLFTQCQAIHARSLLPCQDTPSVKATYSATVEVPEPMCAVMSALPATPAFSAAPRSDWRVYSFHQPVPMASYLIALGVGNLASREVGPRTKVWAEPEVIDAASFEFSETETYVRTIESLLGPYVWGRYDLLMLPPSFPYGGMENPCMTFVTPTLLVGDRSLADVIVHEAAHSWTGNLVTNAVHNAFFLNEGWTMMVQRKVTSKLQASRGETTELAAFDFDALSGLHALEDSVSLFLSRGQAEFTKLVPDLSGVDPDDSFSSIPYEKGFCLLQYIQTIVGVGPFEAFMHDYIQTFKYKSITAGDFRRYTVDYFLEGRFALPRVSHSGTPVHSGACGPHRAEDNSLLAVLNDGAWPVPEAGVSTATAALARSHHSIDLSAVDWDAWFYGTGMPPVSLSYDHSESEAIDSHAVAWVYETPSAQAASASLTAGWGAHKWIAFCQRLVKISSDLLERSPQAVIRPAVLRTLDAVLRLSSSRNAEIRCLWGILSIRSGLQEHFPAVRSFLNEQGRMKFVRPLYRELLRSTLGRSLALDLFQQQGSAYHPICSKMIGVDIKKETATLPVDPTTLGQEGWVDKEPEPASAPSTIVKEADSIGPVAPPSPVPGLDLSPETGQDAVAPAAGPPPIALVYQDSILGEWTELEPAAPATVASAPLSVEAGDHVNADRLTELLAAAAVAAGVSGEGLTEATDFDELHSADLRRLLDEAAEELISGGSQPVLGEPKERDDEVVELEADEADGTVCDVADPQASSGAAEAGSLLDNLSSGPIIQLASEPVPDSTSARDGAQQGTPRVSHRTQSQAAASAVKMASPQVARKREQLLSAAKLREERGLSPAAAAWQARFAEGGESTSNLPVALANDDEGSNGPRSSSGSGVLGTATALMEKVDVAVPASYAGALATTAAIAMLGGAAAAAVWYLRRSR